MGLPIVVRKMRRFAVVTALILLTGACGSGPVEIANAPIPVTGVPEDGLEVEFGETVQVDGGRLSVRFDALLEDSRCPSDVVCVWEGRGRIQLVIQADAGDPRPIEIRIGGGVGNDDGTLVEAEGYVFALRDLTPYPISTETPEVEEYQALLAITR